VVARPAPALGEHTEEVLAEAGLGPEEISALISSGSAAGPSAETSTTTRFLG
jgi:crotonobetainyl-CoA:carnitine CoA-transferase CaiB-like acyl-CoA transferase